MRIRRYIAQYLFGAVILLVSCTPVLSRLDKLAILDEDYPRAFIFRVPECTYSPYSEWEQNNGKLMGILGKCLPEELIERIAHSLECFNRFKQNHPDQLVLLHFDGLARDPYFKSANGDFSAGHWLYHNGATILSDIPEENGTTTIRVSDASLFMVDIGIRNKHKNDDIGLCELDVNGKPNWQRSEQVRLVSIDTETNTIQVERGCYGTAPRAFPAKGSYAAAHCTGGPWGENLLWFYNYSTASPRDDHGNSCTDILVKDIAHRFSPEGELHTFDGIQFDILYFDPVHLLAGTRGNQKTSRGPDVDADGNRDDGFVNGIQTYGIGTNEFLHKLRKSLGEDRLIIGDGGHPHHQRAFGILNGIESEGWPANTDFNLEDWSGGLNRHLFWEQNSRAPTLNFLNHRYKRGFDYTQVNARQVRLVIAASVFINSAYAMADLPARILGYADETAEGVDDYRWASYGGYEIWDELVMGEANRTGWLGQPSGPTVILAENETPVFTAANGSQFQDLVTRLQGSVQFEVENGTLKIATDNPNAGSLRFTLPAISVSSPDLTIQVTTRGDGMQDYPENMARSMQVGISPSTGGMDRLMSWFNANYFQSRFYFNHLPAEQGTPCEVDLEFEFESTEPVWISGIHIYSHPDAMVREFEHGVVLANPSPRSYTFNLSELFPGDRFRRIKGSHKLDPETNDGSPVTGSTLTLDAKDALFLVKESGRNNKGY